MTTNNEGLYTFTQPVILAHPHLITPDTFMRNGKEAGEPKYRCSFVFDAASPDLAALKSLAAKLARAGAPDVPLKEMVFPFDNGTALADARKAKSGKDDGEFQRGKVIMKAASKFQPTLGYVEGGRLVGLETEAAIAASKGKFFFGAEVYGCVRLSYYPPVGKTGKHGVTAYLQSILSTGKGTKLSGGPSIAETFKGYVGAVSQEDPLDEQWNAQLDDEIPF